MIYLLNQMVGDAVLVDSYLNLDIKDDKVIDDTGDEYSMTKLYDDTYIPKPHIEVTPKEIKKKAVSLAKENADKMKNDYSFIVKIKGSYNLNYQESKGYYYHVNLGDSYINISTNGNIIDSFFFNGIIYN